MPSTQQNELLRVTGLKTYYNTPEGILRAVDGISFDIRRGECLSIVGESGSGKSTAALSILRLLESPPARIVDGKIFFMGDDLLKVSEKKLRQIRGKEISMIFQDPQSSLNPVLRVGDQIAEQIILHTGMNKNDAKNRAIALLREVGIPNPEERINEYPHQFSGGMRQRTMIAMALSCDPKLIIADEPTSALDVTIQAQILNIFKELKDRELSILFITHDLGIVADIADRVIVMYAGRVVERGTTLEIFDNPMHPYTRGLLACLPNMFAKGPELPFIPGSIPSLIDPPSGCVFHPRCEHRFEGCDREAPSEYLATETHSVVCHLYPHQNRGKDN
jgi:oligopeptide/dipeptide ABC transporter ATP-binding protein